MKLERTTHDSVTIGVWTSLEGQGNERLETDQVLENPHLLR